MAAAQEKREVNIAATNYRGVIIPARSVWEAYAMISPTLNKSVDAFIRSSRSDRDSSSIQYLNEIITLYHDNLDKDQKELREAWSKVETKEMEKKEIRFEIIAQLENARHHINDVNTQLNTVELGTFPHHMDDLRLL